MWLTPGQHEDVEARSWGLSMWMFNVAKRGRVHPHVDLHKSTLQQLPHTQQQQHHYPNALEAPA